MESEFHDNRAEAVLSGGWRRLSSDRGLGLILVLIALFLFRLSYGLSMNFWKDDERQIYLLGLEWFSTGLWPYFGPDVVHTNQQIAGALQPLLVGLPWHIWRQPEAPFLLVNLLSFSGLLLLAVYFGRLFPQLPRSLLCLWLFTLPWTLNISTHVYNPSYLLFASCLFFVAFCEVIPYLRVGLLAPSWAFCMMGFAIGWSLQLHLSWPLLLPLLAVALLFSWRERSWRWQHALMLAIGFMVPTLVLLPTIVKYGIYVPFAPMLANSGINDANAREPLTIVARLLSFGAYELPRFLTERSQDRWPFLLAHPYLLPFFLVLGAVGVVQPLLALWSLARKTTPVSIRILIVFCILEVCGAFLASSRPPTARNYYILFPFAALAALSGMSFMFTSKRRRLWFGRLVGLCIAYQGLLALIHLKEYSLYTDRDRVVEALRAHNHHLLGDRRSPDLPATL
ncbi:MAG: hypothetical protein NTY08_05020 [Proteobacteria bacterium]|nr:hypothetical protein [Pseudomonadota bacterium]